MKFYILLVRKDVKTQVTYAWQTRKVKSTKAKASTLDKKIQIFLV